VLETRTHETRERRPGVLYLTRERLVFEAPASGRLVRRLVGSGEVETLLDEPLSRIRNVALRQGRWSRARLLVERVDHRAVFDVLEPEAWTVAISEARRHAELAAERRRDGALPGPGPVKLRCRYCRGLAPEAADRCPSCGAPL